MMVMITAITPSLKASNRLVSFSAGLSTDLSVASFMPGPRSFRGDRECLSCHYMTYHISCHRGSDQASALANIFTRRSVPVEDHDAPSLRKHEEPQVGPAMS